MSDETRATQELFNQLDTRPRTGPFTKREVNKLTPVLEDVLEHYVLERAHKRSQLEFQGYVNIDLLNRGVTDFHMQSSDFDKNEVDKTLTVTGLFVWPDLKQAMMIDITFGPGEEP